MKKVLATLLILCAIVGLSGLCVHLQDPKSGHSAQSSTTAKSLANSFDKTKFSTTDPTSPWVVVNKQHSLSPLRYAPGDLTPIGNGQYMRAEAATALSNMLNGAKAATYTLTAASGYRSYDTQVTVYASEVKGFGKTVADSESARPGYSEHQTGWAVDLASGNCSIQDCFSNTPGGKWAITNAYKYGFLLRYPPSLTNITGYRDEAWHFRYVGTLLSNEIHTEHIATLEQFFNIPGGENYN